MYTFVYGTLKQGWGNNRLLVGSEFIGPAVTVDPFYLTDCGFPFASWTGPELAPVRGEVYQIDEATQRRLDGLEGHPNFYERQQVSVQILQSGVVVPDAWMYIVPEATAARAAACPINADGCYEWRTSVNIVELV